VTQSFEAICESAYQLLKQGDPLSIEQGLSMLRREVKSRPSDARALFEYAGAFDFLGRESEAAPLYQRVLADGCERLPIEDQPRLFAQLGSTLRNLKRFDESREVLQQGIERFPEFQALRAFLSLTEFSAGQPEKSVQLLFGLVLQSPDSSIRNYSRALGWYVEKISSYPPSRVGAAEPTRD
jgi:tetratricopeptide (TPR) repeat protein